MVLALNSLFLLPTLLSIPQAWASLSPASSSTKSVASSSKLLNQKIRENRVNQLLPLSADMSKCSRIDCSTHGSCLYCSFPSVCRDESLLVNCSTTAICRKKRVVVKEATCKYCWQTDEIHHSCDEVIDCSTNDVNLVRTMCQVDERVICRGSRVFYKNIRCRWTSGYSWMKTMLLSVTLGGFGCDRFYLGLWKSGVGKLFSFGGLGIWTLVDIALVATGYLQPADGSLYI